MKNQKKQSISDCIDYDKLAWMILWWQLHIGSLASADFTALFLQMQHSKILLKYLLHVNFMYYFLSSCIFAWTLAHADLVPSDFYQTQQTHKPRTMCSGLKTIGSLMKLEKTDTVHSFGWWWARLDQELESEFINLAKDNVIQSRSSNRAAGRIKVDNNIGVKITLKSNFNFYNFARNWPAVYPQLILMKKFL